ncbi:MAG: protoheme IX farnesyltransferase [Deltaproteobacteria bacterium]|nr:protoheme IX farnesyltransferase [Deltaproteobacteria bacterium]MBK8719639.1 protoheme IX farnesyltransferase [Deltaproteobacteria bacterium]MBP7289665.1 heme o synthase [Nannocystaceae bacterium]
MSGSRDPLRALWALTKPSVTRMCVLTTLGGLMLAPGRVSWVTGACALFGTAAAVGGANAFNMWWERDADAKMSRTRRRPLPARVLPPTIALRFAWLLSVVAIAVLWLGTNLLTALLAAGAIASYVLVYTPLKYRTPAALVIGAIPGAAPPLLGWTAVTNSIDAPALVLTAILFLWQLPHFIAIALYRADDYAKAGIRVVPVVRGPAIAKIQAVAWSMVLVPVSLLLVPMGIAGDHYLLAAFVLGSAFLGWAFSGLDDRAGVRWARGYFFASLVYLPALVIALVLDVRV